MDIFDDISDALLSNDEMMLKELERRDGIYSFIFHELEASSPMVSSTTEDDIDVGVEIEVTTEGESSEQFKSDEVAINLEQMQVEPPLPTLASPGSPQMPVESAQSIQPTESIQSMQPTQSDQPIQPIRSIPPMEPTQSDQPAMNTESMFSNAAGLSMITSTLTTTTARSPKFPVEQVKSWHPPPVYAYNRPALYNYVRNCDFRVRVATPSFSHISAPLVRNRRHTLKETADYRRCDGCIYNPPDLRALFPNDPDVHAPFQTDFGNIKVRTAYGNAQTNDTVTMTSVNCPRPLTMDGLLTSTYRPGYYPMTGEKRAARLPSFNTLTQGNRL